MRRKSYGNINEECMYIKIYNNQSRKDRKGVRHMGLGESIKYHRLQANMSQADLAKCLYIHKATLSGYERNKHKPSEEMIAAIAFVLDISTEVIYADAERNLYPFIRDWRAQNLVYPDVEKLKAERMALGLSQRELSKLAHVDIHTVTNIEKGRPVYNYTWKAIEEVLHNGTFAK